MPRFSLSSILLSTLLLLGCATQQGIIERPDWAQKQVVWDYTGVMFSSYGLPAYTQHSVEENARMAEEAALNNLRRLVARELAKAYLKASKASLSEDDAARQLENSIGNILEKQHHYDEQRKVYFIQYFIPATRVEDLVNTTFNTKLKMQSDGTLG